MKAFPKTPQAEKFFIFDCQGNIVGNPKGYDTVKGALRVADYHKPTVKAIRDARERQDCIELENLVPYDHMSRLLHEVKKLK